MINSPYIAYLVACSQSNPEPRVGQVLPVADGYRTVVEINREKRLVRTVVYCHEE